MPQLPALEVAEALALIIAQARQAVQVVVVDEVSLVVMVELPRQTKDRMVVNQAPLPQLIGLAVVVAPPP